MEVKALELVLILGALVLLWRSASRVGASARTDDAEAERKTDTPDRDG